MKKVMKKIKKTTKIKKKKIDKKQIIINANPRNQTTSQQLIQQQSQ